MVFNEGVFTNTVIIILIVWLAGVTIFIYRVWHHYNKLTQGVTKKNLREVLETLVDNYGNLKSNVSQIEKELKIVSESGKYHVQRVGISRYNPFSDTGGSQSFSIAILDSKANGIIMTSLYARTGNRWYVKEVREGKGKELELSKEELGAITKAAPVKLS